MSTTAALVEGHYFMSRAGMDERWAGCQCGAQFDWNDRDKAHALHLLDVAQADACDLGIRLGWNKALSDAVVATYLRDAQVKALNPYRQDAGR